MRLVAILLTALSLTASAQSPLDEWYENESIMNRDQPGNAYYTGNETPDLDIYGDEMQGGGDCRACLTPNPPPFCFEPGHPCDGASVPIDSGVIILILAGLMFGTYSLRKRIA
jgi:hypothetical protein